MADVIKAEEYFYSTTLDKNGASVTWNARNSENLEYTPSERLHIRQILLGHTAKANEYNVVQVEAVSLNGTIKIPIAVLKIGELRSIQSNLEFPEGPVTFTLIEGNGPIYIHGQHLPSVYDEDVSDEIAAEEFLSEEECLEEEDENEDNGNPAKRQKLATNDSKNDTANKKSNNLNNKENK